LPPFYNILRCCLQARILLSDGWNNQPVHFHSKKNPSLPTARSDIALLDVAVGHFGHIEVVIVSDITFPFVREVTNIAYNVVRKAEDNTATGNLTTDEGPSFGDISSMWASLDFHPPSEVCSFTWVFDIQYLKVAADYWLLRLP
jgi:hypothetical protein